MMDIFCVLVRDGIGLTMKKKNIFGGQLIASSGNKRIFVINIDSLFIFPFQLQNAVKRNAFDTQLIIVLMTTRP